MKQQPFSIYYEKFRLVEQGNPTGTIAAVSIALIARVRDPLVAKLNCREHLLATCETDENRTQFYSRSARV